MNNYIRYDSSAAYELASPYPIGLREWNTTDYVAELRSRIAAEKQKKELLVYYYRIGHVQAYPLPIRRLDPLQYPKGIPELPAYPWYIWLFWQLKERWDTLHTAWRIFHDADAGLILQDELASTAEWTSSHVGAGFAGLSSGHLATALAIYLSNQEGWDADKLTRAKQAASTLLDRDIEPYIGDVWMKDDGIHESNMHNIPIIILISGVFLSEILGRPSASAAKLENVLELWQTKRLDGDCYSEGTAYDGFWLDPLTDWLRNGENPLVRRLMPGFRSFVASCLHLALPGRIDIHAPLGDEEPEMNFWMDVVVKLTHFFPWEEAEWLVRRFPPTRMTAAALSRMFNKTGENKAEEPKASVVEHPFAVSMRSGWSSEHCLVAVSASRYNMAHLHHDGGHVVIGHRNRFWITDPGYQQYRRGAERDYSIGKEAHNAPVLNGVVQTVRAAVVTGKEDSPGGYKSVELDLSNCYESLPPHTFVNRSVYMQTSGQTAVLVRDSVRAESAGISLEHFWQIGTFLAYSFVDGWLRLSDGSVAIWIAALVEDGQTQEYRLSQIAPTQLDRHEGSRGGLTVRHSQVCADKRHTCWWAFVIDDRGGWRIPDIRSQDGRPYCQV
ncbi:heparinase II/III family protein [Paenibacillus hodogayensis]|uniref:Heparinase II/III family protein n=1 Tax=Paenibacillus hodogayensis TaxID=279208 RepID=A0ABV5W1Q7_9BACL